MNIAVYCGSSAGKDPAFLEGAAALGRRIALGGHTLVFGASNVGLMGALANGVLEEDGKVIGVVPDIPFIKKQCHPGLTEIVESTTLGDRKQKMIDRADAFVALPGGPGTLDELSDILALIRVGAFRKPVVLFDIGGFYQPLRQVLEGMLAAGFAEPSDLTPVLVEEDLSKIFAFIEGFRG